THYLEEAEQLCDRIAIINHGELIANKTTRELVGMAREKIVRITVDKDLAGPPMEPAFIKADVLDARTIEITYDRDASSAGQVLALVQQHGYAIEDVTTREADLEDVFVQLTRAAAASSAAPAALLVARRSPNGLSSSTSGGLGMRGRVRARPAGTAAPGAATAISRHPPRSFAWYISSSA